MAESKDTITVRVNIEMTTTALKMIVENAKEKAGRDKKGIYRI
jgi:hypothetical protein